MVLRGIIRLKSLDIQPVISLDLDCSDQGSFLIAPMLLLGSEIRSRELTIKTENQNFCMGHLEKAHLQQPRPRASKKNK